jgi:hypothetical protein
MRSNLAYAYTITKFISSIDFDILSTLTAHLFQIKASGLDKRTIDYLKNGTNLEREDAWLS